MHGPKHLVNRFETPYLLKKRSLWLALIASQTVITTHAFALAVEPIRVKSALGEPFRAELVITDIAGLNASSIHAGLASDDEFIQLGIQKRKLVSGLHFTTTITSPERGVITITSDQPLNDPYIEFVVHIGFGNNVRLQQVTALVDPPLTRVQTENLDLPVQKIDLPQTPDTPVATPAPVAAPIPSYAKPLVLNTPSNSASNAPDSAGAAPLTNDQPPTPPALVPQNVAQPTSSASIESALIPSTDTPPPMFEKAASTPNNVTASIMPSTPISTSQPVAPIATVQAPPAVQAAPVIQTPTAPVAITPQVTPAPPPIATSPVKSIPPAVVTPPATPQPVPPSVATPSETEKPLPSETAAVPAPIATAPTPVAPPEPVTPPTPVVPPAPKPVATTPAQPPAPLPVKAAEPPAPKAEEAEAPQHATNGKAYTVQHNDSLWVIATQVQQGLSQPVPVSVIMHSIQQMNKTAFIKDNPNQIRKGAVLVLPNQATLHSAATESTPIRVENDDIEKNKTPALNAQQTQAANNSSHFVRRGHLPDAKMTLVAPTEQGSTQGNAAHGKTAGEEEKLNKLNLRIGIARQQNLTLSQEISELEAKIKANDQKIALQNARLAELMQRFKNRKDARPQNAIRMQQS